MVLEHPNCTKWTKAAGFALLLAAIDLLGKFYSHLAYMLISSINQTNPNLLFQTGTLSFPRAIILLSFFFSVILTLLTILEVITLTLALLSRCVRVPPRKALAAL